MAIIKFTRPIVLATASLARRALVADAGIEFSTQVVSIDESALPNEKIVAYVERLAREKAESARLPEPDAIIVAVDTAIGLKKEIIGKPSDETHARDILKKLSGKVHEVASVIAIRDALHAELKTKLTRTKVKFIKLTPNIIEWYISTGEWKNRAGAYAIQGKGAAFVEKIEGCFTNVIGISMPTLIQMLGEVS